MKKRPATSDLSLNRLQQLLDMCAEGGTDNPDYELDQNRAELLQDKLAQEFTVGAFNYGWITEKMSHLYTVPGLLPCDSINSILNNPQAGITLIKNLKEYAKKLSRFAKSKPEKDVANTIYYAAIAHALVFHATRITAFSYENLGHSFLVFCGKTWIPSNICNLFQRGHKKCIDKVPKN
jgi:hypothetical protein